MKALFLEALPYVSDFRVGSHHYAERFLADGWDVLWISQPLSPLHWIRPQKKDWEERRRGWRHGPVSHGRLRYYSPFTLAPTATLPVFRTHAVARVSARWTVPSLARVIRAEGFWEPDLVWLTNPTFEPLTHRIRGRCTAVRVADDTTAFANVPGSIRELEHRAIANADLVFAVAASVHERLIRTRSHVIRLANGVDAAFFGDPMPEPADLGDLPHPRVLYVGAMERWFDGRLLAECASRLPEATFVLVGPDGPGLRPLDGLANVHWYGPRPYADVPAYMQHADAGVIPFVRSPLVDAVHPIKLYEYLAAGLPVVAVRWPELEAMDAPVTLAERGGFCAALRRTLSSPRPDAERGRAYAQANSWDARFAIIRAEVARVLADGSGGQR
ncbi:MAG: glycosyltransferase [Thermoleophilia bacterium]